MRLHPGAGKPVRPDLHSTRVDSLEEKAAWQAVFGSERPLSITPLPPKGKTAQYRLSIPGNEYHVDDVTASWPELVMQIGVTAGRATISGTWPGLDINDGGVKASFHDIALYSKEPPLPVLAPSATQLKMGSISFDDGTLPFQLDGLALTHTTTGRKNQLEMQIDLRARRISFGKTVLEDSHFAFTLHNMNHRALQDLRSRIERVQQRKLPPAEQKALLSNEFVQFLQLMPTQGASLELTDMSTTIGGGKIRMHGSFAMPGATLADFASMEGALSKADAMVRIEMPTSALRFVARQMAQVGKHAQLPGDDTAANQTYAYMLGKLVADGYALLEKDTLVSVIELRHGTLRINNAVQPIPVRELARLLDPPQADPAPSDEDHSTPVAVLWHDRSFDNLSLFAGNGTPAAMQEMCRRYLEQQDEEQAGRWCAKAGVTDGKPAPDGGSEDQRPGNLVRMEIDGGQYDERYFQFDASKLRRMRISLDKTKANDHWAPMMMVCLSADVPSDMACIAFSRYAPETLKVNTIRFTAGAKERHELATLDEPLPLADTVDLAVYTVNDKVHFVVNGQEHMTQDITFPVRTLQLMCSTADCKFEFP